LYYFYSDDIKRTGKDKQLMKVYHNSFYGMGSRFNAVFPHDDDEVCERIFHSVKSEIIRIERKLSYFDPLSEVSRINREARKNPVRLDDELFNIINTCIEYSSLTGGAYDITMRPVIEAVLNGESSDKFQRTYINDIIIEPDKRTVCFNNDKVKIDFGGFGKGYALSSVKKILTASPLRHAFINFGESSVYVKGNHPGGQNWQIGIKGLADTGSAAYTFSLADASVSSSSNYYSDDTGQLHKKVSIINPFTLRPADDMTVTSVKSSSPVKAEILSTAFFVMKDEDIQKVVTASADIEAVKIRFINNEPVVKKFIRG
jgi:thiamine biosynthesis lipoprotein